MAKVIEDTECTNLTRDVNTIRNEQNKGGNTKTRIANMFQSIITYLNERNIEGGGGGISDLTGYSWWGRSFPTEGTDEQKKTLKGSLSGDIDFIQFSNGVRVGVDSASNTLKVYKDGSTANFYATGGVSALGMSSSGGGGGGTDLGTFLSKLNSDNPNLSQGYLYYNGSTFSMTAGGGGSGLNPNSLAEALNDVSKPTGGTTGYLYFNGSNYSWGNSGGSSNLPIASNDTLGCIKVGNTLTINNGVLNVSQIDIPKASPTTLGGVIVGSGSGLYVDGNGNLSLDSNNITASKLGTRTVGSSTQPIYLNGGSPNLCNTYAGGTAVTLNGDPKAGTTASFYAPTSGGSPNYVLKSNGSTIGPEWVSQSSLTVGKADRLSGTGTRTVWGRTYWQDGGPINVTGNLVLEHSEIIGKDTTITPNVTPSLLTFNNNNVNLIAYGSATKMYPTQIHGETLRVYVGQSTGTSRNELLALFIDNKGQVVVNQSDSYTKGLKIGNAVLYYKNNALCVQNDDGTPANFYATGGVSALGMSAGTSNIDSMTFNYLTVSSRLNIGSSGRTSSIANSDGQLILSGNEGVKIDSPTVIDEDLNVTGYLTAPSFHFATDNTTAQYYFFMSGSTLKFYLNGQTKTVSLV